MFFIYGFDFSFHFYHSHCLIPKLLINNKYYKVKITFYWKIYSVFQTDEIDTIYISNMKICNTSNKLGTK